MTRLHDTLEIMFQKHYALISTQANRYIALLGATTERTLKQKSVFR